jgi:pyruvate/2-oxoglutarate dehydrogenase complex dihydrolipoamide dehydrogenase (E3) component
MPEHLGGMSQNKVPVDSTVSLAMRKTVEIFAYFCFHKIYVNCLAYCILLIVAVVHNWTNMVDEIQNYVKSLNFGYRKVLKENTVTYLNAYAQFVDAHTVKVSL